MNNRSSSSSMDQAVTMSAVILVVGTLMLPFVWRGVMRNGPSVAAANPAGLADGTYPLTLPQNSGYQPVMTDAGIFPAYPPRFQPLPTDAFRR